MAVVWDRLPMKRRNIKSHWRHSPWASMTSLVASTRHLLGTGYPAGDGCGRGRAIFKWEKDPKMNWENPGHAQTARDPVVCVSWQDARAYIAWLNRKAHRGGAASANAPYRLPSEAEWEYAARAGTTTKFYWGDDDAAAPVHAWFNANSGCKIVSGLLCEHGQTHPAGAKPPNAFGLYDMAGNVWQWTEDCSRTNS